LISKKKMKSDASCHSSLLCIKKKLGIDEAYCTLATEQEQDVCLLKTGPAWIELEKGNTARTLVKKMDTDIVGEKTLQKICSLETKREEKLFELKVALMIYRKLNLIVEAQKQGKSSQEEDDLLNDFLSMPLQNETKFNSFFGDDIVDVKKELDCKTFFLEILSKYQRAKLYHSFTSEESKKGVRHFMLLHVSILSYFHILRDGESIKPNCYYTVSEKDRSVQVWTYKRIKKHEKLVVGMKK
jgi:hypothetical protein